MTRRMRWVGLTLAAATLSLAIPGLDSRTSMASPADPADQRAFAALDDYARTELDELSLPGLALAIVHDGQVVHLAGFGHAGPTGRPVTPQTPFMINSVSKSFAGVAVLQLVETGKADLDSPVVDYLPQFRLADRNSAAHLLTLLAGRRRAPIHPMPASELSGGSHDVPQAV